MQNAESTLNGSEAVITSVNTKELARKTTKLFMIAEDTNESKITPENSK